MEPLLDMTVAQHGDRYEIELRGELDSDTAPLAMPNLTAAVDAAAVVFISLDHLAYIDDAGANALHHIDQRAQAQGHELHLSGALDHVRTHLRAAGFTDQ